MRERCYGPRLVKAHSTSDAARLAAVFTGLLLLASVPVAVAADAGGLRSQAAGLQAHSDSLDARAAAATLELYSLESQLGRARTELAGIEARQAALAREQRSARTQLTIAKQALLTSQTELANLARALYQQSGNDPLAVLLGAKSLDEALAGLDGISRAAGQNHRIVEQARGARSRLAGLAARLAERDAELDGLAAAARARTATLAATTSAAAHVHRRAAPAAGAERGPDRVDRGGRHARPTRGRRRSPSQRRRPRWRRSRSPRRASPRPASAR